jgi:hypothetical protein
MLLKNQPNTISTSFTKVVPIRGFARQLQGLYARRTAVDALIQSLEDYQRSRAQRLEQRESKTA